MKFFFLAIYYSLINKIPNSSFPGGNTLNKIRIFFTKKIIHIGVNCTFQKNIYFGNGNNVSIGDNCQINDNARLDNVKIGDNVMVARDSVFLGKSHNYNDINIPMNEQGLVDSRQTIVHNNSWIGIRVIIMPGIEIKSGSVISAGSVLTKSTTKNGVYAGVPAKLIRIRK
jgi:maltose O-acetyltransferase